MDQQPIKYQDVINLGFKRSEDLFDPVFYKQYGFKYFLVEKELSHKHFTYEDKGNIEIIYLDWDCITRTVNLLRVEDNEGDILGKIPIKTLAELRKAIEFYSD